MNQFCCQKGNSGSEARLGTVTRPTTRPGSVEDDGAEELEGFLRLKLGEPEEATVRLPTKGNWKSGFGIWKCEFRDLAFWGFGL